MSVISDTRRSVATACGGSTNVGSNSSSSGTQQPAGDQSAGAVLPVTDNPITKYVLRKRRRGAVTGDAGVTIVRACGLLPRPATPRI